MPSGGGIQRQDAARPAATKATEKAMSERWGQKNKCRDFSDPIFLTALSSWAVRAAKNPNKGKKMGAKKSSFPIFLPPFSCLSIPIWAVPRAERKTSLKMKSF